MGIPLRVLIVEDSEDDALLIARQLQRSGYDLVARRIDTAQAMHAALAEGSWDVIIADYSMPRFDGLSALKLVQESGIDLPFILVSGTIGEDTAVAAMRAGAHDYVLKDKLARLGPAIRRELHEAQERQARWQVEQSLLESEARFRRMADHIQDGLVIVEHNKVAYANERACEIFGYPREEFLKLSFPDFAAPGERTRLRQFVSRNLGADPQPNKFEFWITRQDGSQRCIESRFSLSRNGDQVTGHYVVVTDITERKRAELLLQSLNTAALAVEQALTLREVLEAVGQELNKLGFSCTILQLDEAGTKLTPKYYTYDAKAIRAIEMLLGIKASDFALPIESVQAFRETIQEGKTILLDGPEGLRQILPQPLQRFAGQVVRILQVPKSINAPLVVDDEVIGLLSVQSDDLTEGDIPAITAFAHQLSAAWRKAKLLQDLEESLAELKRTQAQFLQAQKMEAVGRLAGGVAHDFNNTLTIIQLSLQFLKRNLYSDDPLWEYVEQIEDASERAANLTRQLLSFSRREIVKPRILNLSQVVDNLSRMLRRLIGENIELITVLDPDPWPVCLDPTQADQAIVNLVVNARDAMVEGGQLTIETSNVVLDQVSASEHMGIQPGEYVRLAVSDTGMGIDDEVKKHIFEPFFTTKEREHGTGLGLSTVFGIVKQNGGDISVHSALGQGTTFTIHLPRSAETDRLPPPPAPTPDPLQGTETVLVVEDDDAVRNLAARVLRTKGYQVLTARGGHEALEISKQHDGPLHLLLTDMIMPRMSGRDLAEQLQPQRPEMQVLFISGHSYDVITDQGVLGEGVFFLAKPFDVETLARKVREVLDAGALTNKGPVPS